MTIQHKDIPDSGLHEPKGASTASFGEVYRANGTGSGEWVAALGSAVVIVNSESDFPDAVAGVRTLEDNTTYVINGSVTTGDRLVAGVNNELKGESTVNCTLTYTGTGNFITFTNTEFRISRLTINCPLATLIKGTGDGQLRILNLLNFVCSSCVNGLNLDDITIVASTCRFSGYTGKVIEYIGGTDIVALSLVRVAFLEADASSLAIDLGSATFQTFEINDAIHGGLGTFVSGLASGGNITSGGIGTISGCDLANSAIPLVGLTTDDVAYAFTNNFPLQDTMPDALLYFNSNATNTVVNTGGTFELVTGTWVQKRISQFTSNAAGRLTWGGVRPVVVPVTFRLVVSPVSGSNVDVSTALYINGVLDTGSASTVEGITSADSVSVTTPWQVELQPGDYLEVFVTTNTGTDLLVTDAILRTN